MIKAEYRIVEFADEGVGLFKIYFVDFGRGDKPILYDRPTFDSNEGKLGLVRLIEEALREAATKPTILYSDLPNFVSDKDVLAAI